MNQDFDKEMDALLRRTASIERSAAATAATARSGNGTEFPTPHLDADEISAFAENALPEKTRRRHTAHLADCDSCRISLSELISLNAQAEAEAAPEEEPAAAVDLAPKVPWYRKLLRTPNLAYMMGALVLVFAGFAFFTVFQNQFKSGDLSAKSEAPTSTPLADESSQANSPSSEPAGAETKEDRPDAPRAESDVPGTGEDDTLTPEPPTARPTPVSGDADDGPARPVIKQPEGQPSREDIAELSKTVPAKPTPDITTTDSRITTGELEKDNKPGADVAAEPASQPAPAPGGNRKAEENVRRETFRVRDGMDVEAKESESKKADKSKNQGRAQSSRQIGGKTFRRADGVWYDADYRNQPTINVRRGTDEYRQLDSGLRSIAEKLDGTVVVAWKSKAYRID